MFNHNKIKIIKILHKLLLNQCKLVTVVSTIIRVLIVENSYNK